MKPVQTAKPRQPRNRNKMTAAKVLRRIRSGLGLGKTAFGRLKSRMHKNARQMKQGFQKYVIAFWKRIEHLGGFTNVSKTKIKTGDLFALTGL